MSGIEFAGIAVLITTISSAFIGIISQIQHSRCVKLKVCWGLCDCIRNVPDVHEPTVEITPNSSGVT
tara:strand:+ start:2059 stop:2259 length:201 start_codon:yes stop_codon:yes gene_type:complete